MTVKVYDRLPEEAKAIRTEVFVDEQGFTEEFDRADHTAIHLVGFIDDKAVATSRIIKINDTDYMIGRIAVLKANRKGGLGARIVYAAEDIIREHGGNNAFIHAQMQAVPFYERIGYTLTGETDVEEGCPHAMMSKKL